MWYAMNTIELQTAVESALLQIIASAAMTK
jgi:hypothetical protein